MLLVVADCCWAKSAVPRSAPRCRVSQLIWRARSALGGSWFPSSAVHFEGSVCCYPYSWLALSVTTNSRALCAVTHVAGLLRVLLSSRALCAVTLGWFAPSAVARSWLALSATTRARHLDRLGQLGDFVLSVRLDDCAAEAVTGAGSAGTHCLALHVLQQKRCISTGLASSVNSSRATTQTPNRKAT